MNRLTDLKRQRLAKVDEARALLDKIKDERSEPKLVELEREHSALMREIDHIDLDIAEARDDAGGEDQRARMRPPMGGGEAYADDGMADAFPAGWTDTRGNPVRVLSSREPFSESRNRSGMSFGDYARALAVGARNDAEKRALSEGTGAEGGFTVPTPLASEFIDRLRAQSVAIRAGARTVPMDSASLAIARLDTDPTVTWRLENSLIDDSDPAFSRLLLEAKAVAGIVKVSRELLSDSVNISEILTNAFAQAMALELDRVALWNDGADDGPVGVAATSGINEVSMGTNGAALTDYDKLIDAVYEMQVDNAADPTGMIYHPRTGAAMAKLRNGNGDPLQMPEMIARIPRYPTTSASITQTQGSSNNASSVLFGDFRHLFIGVRDQMSITVLRERYADYGQVGFLCWMRADVQLAHKASFSRLKGIVPA